MEPLESWSAVLKICKQAHVLDHGKIVMSGRSDQVVRWYLNRHVSVPVMSGRARFAGEIPQTVTWRVGETAILPLVVEIQEDLTVHLIFAVEHMAIGVGWEIVINGIDNFVAACAGRYQVDLTIPNLPLAPGNYLLDINLVLVNPKNPLERQLLDGRGWLKGSPIELIVVGRSCVGRTVLPVEWDLATT